MHRNVTNAFILQKKNVPWYDPLNKKVKANIILAQKNLDALWFSACYIANNFTSDGETPQQIKAAWITTEVFTRGSIEVIWFLAQMLNPSLLWMGVIISSAAFERFTQAGP